MTPRKDDLHHRASAIRAIVNEYENDERQTRVDCDWRRLPRCRALGPDTCAGAGATGDPDEALRAVRRTVGEGRRMGPDRRRARREDARYGGAHAEGLLDRPRLRRRAYGHRRRQT